MEGQAPKAGTFGSSLNNPNPTPSATTETKAPSATTQTKAPSATTQAKAPETLRETYEQLLKKGDGLVRDFFEERYITIALSSKKSLSKPSPFLRSCS